MGLENRDWYRDAPTDSARATAGYRWWVAAAVLFGIVALIAIGQRLLYGPGATYGAPRHELGHDASISVFPGTPKIRISTAPLYAANDPWRAYLADDTTCPGGEQTDRPLEVQASTMLCLVNWARRKRGLNELRVVAVLNQSSIAKANRIQRCQDFDHDACGPDPSTEVRAAGYQGSWGENLIISSSRFGAPRVALDGWLNSPGHRRNLFRPEWRTLGIAVSHLPRFGRDKDMWLWVNQFGDR